MNEIVDRVLETYELTRGLDAARVAQSREKIIRYIEVPSEMRLEFVWRILREHEGIVSGGKVNRLIDGLCGERLPTIHLAHVDLS
jgi:hypothetical protein